MDDAQACGASHELLQKFLCPLCHNCALQKRAKLKEELGLGDNWGDSDDEEEDAGVERSAWTTAAQALPIEQCTA